jgi:hypothetical protein
LIWQYAWGLGLIATNDTDNFLRIRLQLGHIGPLPYRVAEPVRTAARRITGLQNAMSASPLISVDLSKKFMSHATENVTAAMGLVQKLSHANSLEEVVKIQTEFVSKQLDPFTNRRPIPSLSRFLVLR